MVVMVVVLLVLYRVYPCLPVYPEVYLLTSVSEYAQSPVLDPRCARLDASLSDFQNSSHLSKDFTDMSAIFKV